MILVIDSEDCLSFPLSANLSPFGLHLSLTAICHPPKPALSRPSFFDVFCFMHGEILQKTNCITRFTYSRINSYTSSSISRHPSYRITRGIDINHATTTKLPFSSTNMPPFTPALLPPDLASLTSIPKSLLTSGYRHLLDDDLALRPPPYLDTLISPSCHQGLACILPL
ncbi:hypothetical protein B0H65DRAFT_184061 [Neurospora tetraspora]|uniref:Uncharacterized protein n=1 Tax=Neurospora tetraspora TaxID=94610 RepID=A0AAE0MRL3_9PEZI|nr:hypothetical protein B0H65DRAFT_184061 [Neurospora tetraspora]